MTTATDVWSDLERAVRNVDRDLLVAYIDNDAQRDVTRFLLRSIVSDAKHPSPEARGLTLRDVYTQFMEPRRNPAVSATSIISTAVPFFDEIDATLRALVAQRWVTAHTDPTTDTERFSVSPNALCRIFAPMACREIEQYEERVNSAAISARAGEIAYECVMCGHRFTLTEVLQEAAEAGLLNTDDPMSIPCPDCGFESNNVKPVTPPTDAEHARIKTAVRPLLASVQELASASEAVERLARAAVARRPEMLPPTLVRARFLRERRSSTRWVPNFDVYIGQPTKRAHGTLERTEWSMPFAAHGVRTPTPRDLDRFRAHVRGSPVLVAALKTLRGKRMGCDCTLQACHGAVLVELFRVHCV